MYEDIALGGKEIFINNNSKTLLIAFHGFTARPQVLLPLFDELKGCDFDIYAPITSCHGKSEKEFKKSTLRKWLNGVRIAVESKIEKYDNVFVMGHSLGGLFAMYSGYKYPKVKGIITFATPYKLTDKKVAAKLVESVEDKEGYLLGKRLSWGMTVPRPPKKSMGIEIKGLYIFILRDYLKGKIKKFKQNILNIHSIKDEVADFSSQQIYSSYANKEKFESVKLEKSMHTYFNREEVPIICKNIIKFIGNNK